MFSKVCLSKVYFCEMYPTCVSFKLCEFICILFFFSFNSIQIFVTTQNWNTKTTFHNLSVCLLSSYHRYLKDSHSDSHLLGLHVPLGELQLPSHQVHDGPRLAPLWRLKYSTKSQTLAQWWSILKMVHSVSKVSMQCNKKGATTNMPWRTMQSREDATHCATI